MIVFLLVCLLLLVLALASYADRVYSEMGKFLVREYQDNLDAWVDLVEPRLGLSRDNIALSATIVRDVAMAALALLFARAGRAGASLSGFLITLLELAVTVIVVDRLIPLLLFGRTKGDWARRFALVYRVLFYVTMPLTLLLGLLLSIVSLTEPSEAGEEPTAEEGVDALLEAGEEEGILEESDRALVRSVVEFGDMVVREVMTPRPEIFAVPETTSLTEFTELLSRRAYSRVPVYTEKLDNITGIAFAHDLLNVSDEEARTITVDAIKRKAEFVPEPKKVNELLREMRREKQHMRIVIDEYGAVAGLVTIEDLIEAIVGNIEDEHETSIPNDQVKRLEDGAWAVPGSLDIADLRDLLTNRGDDNRYDDDEEEDRTVRLPAEIESTTVGGLVSEISGHIPLPGEVVEAGDVRLEVLSSTSRLVTRVKAALMPREEDDEA